MHYFRIHLLIIISMQPPKKKGKGGKKKGGGSSNMVDGVATAEMTKEQLEQHVFRLREEMEREREERNFFQLERDKIRTFWEITRQQLEERLAELRLVSNSGY
jgi:membrane protein involved in colicin uptake